MGMLGLLVLLRIVRKIAGRFVVRRQVGRTRLQSVDEFAQVDDVLSSLGESIDLRLARRKRYTLLLARAPVEQSILPEDAPTRSRVLNFPRGVAECGKFGWSGIEVEANGHTRG